MPTIYDRIVIEGHVVDTVKYAPLRETMHVDLFFERPIFEWAGMLPKFFGMIFSKVGAKIPVSPKEFSVTDSANMGETSGRYNIYGGASSISIFVDRLAADFPLLAPSEYALVRVLLKTVHDEFISEFPNCPVSRVEYSSGDHIEILAPHTVKEFLGRY